MTKYYDDKYQIELSYNTVPLGVFVNRSGLMYDSEKKTAAFTGLSYNFNILNYFSINYLIGDNYNFDSKENYLVNSLTLKCDICRPLEYYFSYWMRGSPQDDHIWLGLGVNIFLDKKLFFNK